MGANGGERQGDQIVNDESWLPGWSWPQVRMAMSTGRRLDPEPTEPTGLSWPANEATTTNMTIDAEHRVLRAWRVPGVGPNACADRPFARPARLSCLGCAPSPPVPRVQPFPLPVQPSAAQPASPILLFGQLYGSGRRAPLRAETLLFRPVQLGCFFQIRVLHPTKATACRHSHISSPRRSRRDERQSTHAPLPLASEISNAKTRRRERLCRSLLKHPR